MGPEIITTTTPVTPPPDIISGAGAVNEITTSSVAPLDVWSENLRMSFQDMWHGVINTVPNIIAAIVIFVVGWVVGDVLGDWVNKLVKSIRLDKALESLGIDAIISKSGHRLDSGMFIGSLVKWFIIIVFLVAALNIVQLTEVTFFLRQVLAYIPRVIVAILVLGIGAVLSEWLSKLVAGSARAMGITSAGFLAGLVRWLTWLFAFLFAFDQLVSSTEAGQSFAAILFQAVVYTAGLGLALAFGLGGRDAAARFIERLREEISSHRR